MSLHNVSEALLTPWLPCVCGALYAAAESGVGFSTQLPTCRFWNSTASQWSSSGVLTLGVLWDAQGRTLLSCASTHLTAFTGTRGSAVSTGFKLNLVHPIDDAGNISVGVTVCCVLSPGRCVLCTVYCVLCTVYCVLCTVYCVLRAVYCVLCTVYCVLCTVYWEMCAVCCVLCAVYCVLCALSTNWHGT